MSSQSRYAVMTYVFAKFSLKFAIEAIADSGWRYVELWGGYPHLAVDHVDADYVRRQIKPMIAHSGLEVTMYTPEQLMYPVAISSSDRRIREYSIDYFRRSADIAAALGSGRMLLTSGSSLLDDDVETSMSHCLQSMEIICEHARDLGVTVVLEPLAPAESRLVNSLSTLERAYEALQHLDVEVMADLVPLDLRGESLSAYFGVFGSRLSTIHFIDGDGTSPRHLIPGQGRIDLRNAAEACKAAGFSGVVSLELGAAYHDDPVPAVNQAIKYVEDLFGTCADK